MLSKLAALAAGATLAAAACAPGGGPPDIPIAQQGVQWATQVVDQVNDVGRSPSIGLDKNGNPSVAYLLVKPVLAKGAIPPAPVANTPEPPSVVLAYQSGGIWTRRGVTVTENQPVPKGYVGTATEIADSKGHYLPGVSTAMALDKDGRHHVVWSTPGGLFYSVDQALGSGAARVLVFPDKPTQITKAAALGASIAVAPNGTPWISYYQGTQVKLATPASPKSSKWVTKTLATATPCGSSPACDSIRTAIAFASDGQPFVAYSDGGKALMLVPGRTGAGVQVGSQRAGLGVSLAFDSSGDAFLAYYTASGEVDLATAAAGSVPWKIRKLGSGGQGQPATAGAAQAWTTGLGVSAKGDALIAWSDLSKNAVMEAQGAVTGGPLKAQEVPQSDGGWSPSAAVSADGKHAAIAWFDSVNKHLDVAVPFSQVGGLAVPSPSFSPLPTAVPSGVAPCKPTGSGTAVSVAAKNLAFDANCLAVDAGKAFTVDFNNQDSGTPHNVEIYQNSSATKRLGGATGVSDTVTGPGTTSYKVTALPAGIYYFQCDVHPFMNGTFVVAKA